MAADLVPCAVFAFNRPEKLARVLKALRAQQVDQLLVFVDGPRSPEDIEKVEKSRAIAEGVDWVDKQLYFWDENHGLRGLSDNISLVLEKFSSAVFVEDDCLPMPGFYPFMRQALEHYAAADRVFSIGGYQCIRPDFFKDYPYSLVSCARFTCWGWATWQNRWQAIQPTLARYQELFDGLQHVPQIAGADLPGMARAMASGRTVESWDIKVSLACLWLKKVHLLAVRGLVRNIGHDLSGIHRGLMNVLRSKLIQNQNVTEEALEKICWLDNLDLNFDYAGKLQEFVSTANALSYSRLKQRGAVVMRRYLLPGKERVLDLDLVKDPAAPLKKRALLSYIVHPFSLAEDDPRFLRHINIWHAQEMARSLNRLGYRVDVIDYRDTEFHVRQPYDLFIGHGGVNFEAIAKQLPASTKKIYFSTGSYWKFNNQQEAARFAALKERRGIDLPSDRSIFHSEDAAIHLSDGVIGIGNQATGQTYAGFSPVIMIDGTSLYDDSFEWQAKDYTGGRKNFVFFAGGGNVHKGLDLLLEAFSGLEEHLWIGSKLDAEFSKAYEEELLQSANIHALGWVQPRSSQFYQVMNVCNFCLLPSCSEGQSQSVVECMNQGLIPVVSQAAGIEVEDFGVTIEPCTIEQIRLFVQDLASWSPARCQEMSLNARRAAQSRYSEDRFSANFQAAVVKITGAG